MFYFPPFFKGGQGGLWLTFYKSADGSPHPAALLIVREIVRIADYIDDADDADFFKESVKSNNQRNQ